MKKFVRLPGQTWVDPHGHGERGIVDSDWRPVKVMVMVVDQQMVNHCWFGLMVWDSKGVLK